MKVVFDTNVYVSMSLFGGVCEKLVQTGEGGAFRVYISQYILDEHTRVLVEKFGLPRRLVHLRNKRIRRVARVVGVTAPGSIVAGDPEDDPVLATGLKAKAHYLITGDDHLLSLERYHSLRIITPRQFHEMLAARGLVV